MSMWNAGQEYVVDEVWAVTNVGVIVTQLPELAGGQRLIGASIEAHPILKDGILDVNRRVCFTFGFRPDMAALLIEAVKHGAKKRGLDVMLTALRDQADVFINESAKAVE